MGGYARRTVATEAEREERRPAPAAGPAAAGGAYQLSRPDVHGRRWLTAEEAREQSRRLVHAESDGVITPVGNRPYHLAAGSASPEVPAHGFQRGWDGQVVLPQRPTPTGPRAFEPGVAPDGPAVPSDARPRSARALRGVGAGLAVWGAIDDGLRMTDPTRSTGERFSSGLGVVQNSMTLASLASSTMTRMSPIGAGVGAARGVFDLTRGETEQGVLGLAGGTAFLHPVGAAFAGGLAGGQVISALAEHNAHGRGQFGGRSPIDAGVDEAVREYGAESGWGAVAAMAYGVRNTAAALNPWWSAPVEGE